MVHKRTLTSRDPSHAVTACAALFVWFGASASHAENIGLPETAGPGTFIFATEPQCGTLDFVDNELISTSGQRVYRIAGTDINIMGSMRARASVDPVAGNLIRSASAVSVESGLFSFTGSSTELGLVNETLLHGRVVGVYHLDENQPVFFFNWVIDVDHVHPALTGVIGPIQTVEHRVYESPWIGPPSDQPWKDEFSSLSGCFTNSPELKVFPQPLPGPRPVTFQLTGTTAVFPSSACPFIGAGNQLPVSVQFTFDANARDLNTFDPNIGEYVSCDDTYGSRSGATIRVGDFSWRTACVAITVQNDSPDGSPGSQVADLYTVELIGDTDVSGTLLRLEDTSAQAFVDDRLPSIPPILTTPPSPPGSFVLLGGPNTSISLDGVCEIVTDAMTLTQVGDADFDGVPDTQDNCILKANTRQRDSDDDGFGNACDPDLNGDRVVNAVDLGLFKSVFFSRGNLDADFNSDGVVNVSDLGVLRAMFFAPPGPSAVAP